MCWQRSSEVRHEQGGKRRTEYGTKLLPELAKNLTARFGKGFSKSNLANRRQFYLMYSPIFQTLSGKSVSANLQTLSAKFPLSWSHYLFLMSISNPVERQFYEFVDLVFFNRLLQCFVLIDLKLGDITHQDLGQMQMYVNYYDRKVKLPTENPTVGILLCKKKNNAVVEMTLPKDNTQIFASKYELVLPDKKELMRLLEENFTDEE